MPVIAYTDDTGAPHTSQLIRLAFATRVQAVEAAERHLEAVRTTLARRLAEPRHRALRESYGLPREVAR